MDIRIINREGELINVSRLSLKVIGRSLIGISEKQDVVNVETYESEEMARRVLKRVIYIIWAKHNECDNNAVIIDLNGRRIKEEEEERGERDGESK